MSQEGIADFVFEPAGSRFAATPAEQKQILAAADWLAANVNPGAEFGRTRVEGPVQIRINPHITDPAEYDVNSRGHVIDIHPRTLRRGENLRSVLGHELHHAFATDVDAFDTTAALEFSANQWEARNAGRLGASPRYRDYTNRLIEFYGP